MTTDSMKTLVFGGAGFIGTNICLSALDRGGRVVVFDDLSRSGVKANLGRIVESGGERVETVIGDVRDRKAVADVLGCNPGVDTVFHMAGQVAVTTSLLDPRADFEANLAGTINILETIRTGGIDPAFVFASTNKVYGDLRGVAVEEGERRFNFKDFPKGIDESFPLSFSTPYGCSKGAADQYVLDYAKHFGLRSVVMRQSCIYGPNQFGAVDQGWIAWFTIAAMLGKPITIYGNGKQVRDALYVDDLIDAYWAAIGRIDAVKGEAFNLGGGKYNVSLLELLALLEELLSRKIEIDFAPERAGDQKVFVCDTQKAARELDWTPSTDLRKGLKNLIEWVDGNRDVLSA
ncbi:MAG TPA: NAD-dependent epimerase/dehydratase family protein [Rhodospirillales bacterium]|nr:NAD-dependent epimerase/dehydratase family protein [Rhodospirillales bacterium]